MDVGTGEERRRQETGMGRREAWRCRNHPDMTRATGVKPLSGEAYGWCANDVMISARRLDVI